MQDLLLGGQPIVLDASAVGRVSTPCIQVLLATLADARLRGLPFRLQEPSPVLVEALANLGLASHFGLQERP